MAERSIVEAINDCFYVELERDESVLVLGEDVGRAGGVFRATAGLLDRFGPDRCVDTPLAEAGIMGTAIGLCMAGWRPVCEMQYDAFSYPALDQLINHVGRYRWRTRGAMEFPITIRMPYGGGVRAPELHDDSPETYYVHTPGVKVAIPSTPSDAKGLLAAAIRDPDPVVILEPKLHYRTIRGEVPDGEHVVPLGKARIAREGTDVTLVAYGSMVPVAEQAAETLAGEASAEVLDLRSLKPLDEEALLASAAKTGRVVVVQEAPRVCGFAAEVAAVLAEKAILDLRAPVLRVTGYDVPYPFWQLEDVYMPSEERVVDAARRAARVLTVLHEIPLDRRTLHGHFSRDLEPILTVDSGDTIAISSPNAGWWLSRDERFEPRDQELDRGHALIGPVEVRGAAAGQTLEVRIESIRAGSWGVTEAGGFETPLNERLGVTALESRTLQWTLDPDAGTGIDQHGREVALRPFLGVLGMPPPEAGVHPTYPPRVSGGNIDCKELVAGTTLFLPIPVDGALFSAGDGHARQGDGEVSQLAIECPVDRAELTLSVRDDLPLESPIAWTPEAWVAFGFDEDLDEAAAIATDGMLQLMGREHGLERCDALALASVVADLRVTQLVNGVRGVHAMLRHDAIRFTTIS